MNPGGPKALLFVMSSPQRWRISLYSRIRADLEREKQYSTIIVRDYRTVLLYYCSILYSHDIVRRVRLLIEVLESGVLEKKL